MDFNYIGSCADQIEGYFKNFDSLKKINIEDINKHRTHAFMMQAFGRVIKKAYKKNNSNKAQIRKAGEVIKISSKYIEDSIGDYLYHFEMREFSNSKKKISDAKLRLEKSVKNFEMNLSSIRESFSALNSKKLKNIYLKGCVRELKAIVKAVDCIDANLLEDGTHELRRKLRWVIMYVIYPQGLFKYIEKNPKVTKYTKLTPVDSYGPVAISFSNLNFLSESVYRLGKVKDAGLANNYNKSYSKINESNSDAITLTQNILDELKNNKVIENLRDEIKKTI